MVNYKELTPLFFVISLIIVSFLILKPFFTAIALGALFAYIFYPLYAKLHKKVSNKALCAILICLVVLILIGVPSILLVNTIIRESYTLFIVGKQKIATGLFINCTNSFCTLMEEIIQTPEIHFQIQEILKGVTNWVIEKGSSILLSLPKLVLNTFIIFFTMFYFLKEGEHFTGWVGRIIGLAEKKYNFVVERLKEIVRAVVYGYVIVALFQGALGALGFFLFGVSSPLFWGAIMAILALIPYLGTGIVWFPAALFLFLEGVFQDSSTLIFKGIGLFLYSLIFVSTLDNILKPKLIGEKAQIHPVTVLLGTVGGIFLLGPIGIILGPLILSIAVVLVDLYLNKSISTS